MKSRILFFFRGAFGITFVAAAGLACSVFVALYLHNAEHAEIRQETERRATLRHALLRESLGEYHNALFALRLLIENSVDLSLAEFNHAAADILARSAGIQAVQWAPILQAETLPPFVTRVRSTLFPDFSINQLGPSGRLEPLAPEPRYRYAPITYVHPLKGNEATVGYDIFTAPTADTLAFALANQPATALSQPFRLIQGGEGVVLACVAKRLPADVPPPNGGQGIVQIVLRIEESIRRQWNLTPNYTLDVLLADDTASSHPFYLQIANRLIPEAVLPDTPADFLTPDTISHELRIGGRTWRAYYRPNAAWLASHRHPGPYLTFFGGLGLTSLTILYLVGMRRRHDQIRRQVEERTAELNESRILLNAIIDHNPASIWVKDTSLRYCIANHTFARYHHLDRDQILGLTDDALYDSQEARTIQESDRQVLASAAPLSLEATFTAKGHNAVFLVSKFPIRNTDGVISAVAGIATDITALRAAESATLVAERRLQESRKLESLGVLAGGVAHDFNNLLTGILGHANLARLGLPPAAPAQQSLAQIEISVQRAAELCQQMLAYSGRGRLAINTIQLGLLVQDTVGLIRHTVSPAATLRLELADALPPVSGDSVQLRQIIMNLVLNAAESLPEGRGTVTLRTRLVAADAALFATCVSTPDLPSGDYLCLEISDDGSGMPPDTLARIFEPFFTTKFTGRGLGLAATLGIVRSHNGALAVSSIQGQGTSFRLYLPVAPGSPDSPSSGLSAGFSAQRSRSSATAPHLLLVDDDDSVRETAAILLASLGYRVTTAADGAQALDRFSSEPRSFAAAIVDLTMPGLGGIEVLARLRLARPDLPVLIISGYSEHDVRLDSTVAHRVDFLSKPFTLEQLRDKLHALLGPNPESGPQG